MGLSSFGSFFVLCLVPLLLWSTAHCLALLLPAGGHVAWLLALAFVFGQSAAILQWLRRLRERTSCALHSVLFVVVLDVGSLALTQAHFIASVSLVYSARPVEAFLFKDVSLRFGAGGRLRRILLGLEAIAGYASLVTCLPDSSAVSRIDFAIHRGFVAEITLCHAQQLADGSVVAIVA